MGILASQVPLVTRHASRITRTAQCLTAAVSNLANMQVHDSGCRVLICDDLLHRSFVNRGFFRRNCSSFFRPYLIRFCWCNALSALDKKCVPLAAHGGAETSSSAPLFQCNLFFLPAYYDANFQCCHESFSARSKARSCFQVHTSGFGLMTRISAIVQCCAF